MTNSLTFKQIIDLQSNVAEYYANKYPNDIYANNHINKDITFLDIFLCILKPKTPTYTDNHKANDLYTLVGLSNREVIDNLYDKLAIILETHYEDILDIECNDVNW